MGYRSIETGSGNDTIQGNGGNNVINTGYGNDFINGLAGSDTIELLSGEDITIALWKGAYQETGQGSKKIWNMENVTTGDENDNVVGTNWHNIFETGSGDDTITSLNGLDVFKFNENFGNDTITDFDLMNDTIDLSEIIGASFDAEESQTGVKLKIFDQNNDQTGSIVLNEVELDAFNLKTNDIFIFESLI